MGRTRSSRSAEVVAAERALLADRGLVDDPFARSMLGPSVGLLYRLARRAPGVIPTLPVTLAGLAARVRWHDDQVTSALDGGVDQVASIGAGYDSRAWRLRRDGVRSFELDDPATQATKVRRAPAAGPVYVPADLRTTDAAAALATAGLDLARPVVVVLEGVTMYLTEADVRRTLYGLASACAPGSVLTTDFYPPSDTGSSADRRQTRLQDLARAGSGEALRLLLDRDDAASLVRECDWNVDGTMGMRAAAALLPPGHGLPVERVNDRKTLLVASLGRPQDPTHGEV